MNKNRTIQINQLNLIVYLAVSLAMALLVYSLLTIINTSPLSLTVGSPPSDLSIMPALSQGQAADAARLAGLAARYQELEIRANAQAAESARWNAMAEYYGAKPALSRAQAAEAARWTALAAEYASKPALNRSQAAEAARLTGLAASLENRKIRVQAAEAARLTGLAEYYANKPALSRVQAAEAARWTALAIFYNQEPEYISPEVNELLGR
jgi:hypothetical protein